MARSTQPPGDQRTSPRTSAPSRCCAGVTCRSTRAARRRSSGPSGSGKTTLLRLIAGFERADSRHVSLSGRTLGGRGRLGAGAPPRRRLRGPGRRPLPAPHRRAEHRLRHRRRKAARRAARPRRPGSPSCSRWSRSTRRSRPAAPARDLRRAAAARGARPGPRPRARAHAARRVRSPPSTRGCGSRPAAPWPRCSHDAGITTVLVTHDQAEALASPTRWP